MLISACNSTKFVPEGEFLLDKATIKTENKDLNKTELNEFLRQTPNAAVFGLWRMQLGIYNLASKDSTKFLSNTWKKIGDPPVIYNAALTSISVQQLQLALINKGYMDARVESRLNTKGKKAQVEYIIKSNTPYKLGEYTIGLKNEQLVSIASDTSKMLIRKNMLFNTDILNAERERISSLFRKQGYYNFSKDYLAYTADSTNKSHKIDVTLELQDYLKHAKDSVNKILFKKLSIGKVIFYINTDDVSSNDITDNDKFETISFRDFEMVTPKKHIITLDALVQNTYINPKSLYSDEAVERTYQSLNSLGPIKYVNISFKEKENDQLDCYIIIVPSKTISLSAEAEGTYTAGFWGLAGNLNYVDRNIYKGAETFSLTGRAALEWQKDVLAREFGVQAGLKFPRFMLPVGSYDFKRNIHANTEFTGAFSYQYRPGEFTTTNVGAGINYSWTRRQYHHSFQLFDLSYVQFPVVEQAFKDSFINSGKYNPYNYQDHFIMRTGYSGYYSTFNSNRPLKNYSSVRYSLELAGNVLYGLSNLLGATKEDGAYKLFGVRYSQYVKGEYNISHHQIFDKDNRFVYHLGVGLGIPYGNGNVIPYEKRFYSGGANSVRGWSESQLGPGVYNRIPGSLRDFNQVGDIKLDMNMEYRAKLAWIMEGAAFLDAGNIWTISNYSTQPGGQFKLDTFMNQIAISYGLGLRFDFKFFIGRVDLGVKLFDPVQARRDQWRTSPEISKDFVLHFAIGYPF